MLYTMSLYQWGLITVFAHLYTSMDMLMRRGGSKDITLRSQRWLVVGGVQIVLIHIIWPTNFLEGIHYHLISLYLEQKGKTIC